MEGDPRHADLMQCVWGALGRAVYLLLVPGVSLLVQLTGVDSLHGPSEHLSSGPRLSHTALYRPLCVQGCLVSAHWGSRCPAI